MGLILTRLLRVFWSGEEHKIIIVGLDNAGKTTILYKLLLNEVVATSPTIGNNVEEVVYKNIRFAMWDIGGQESLRASWATYYAKAKCVLMVVDSSDRDRLHICKAELHKMMQNDDLKQASLLVYANKQDVKNVMQASEISATLALSSFRDRAWHIQSCCALTGEGVSEPNC